MAAVIPTASKAMILEDFLVADRTFTYHLYTAIDPALDTSTALEDLTEVSGDATYAAQDVIPADWTFETSGTRARATVGHAGRLIFNLTDAVSILGYYITWHNGTSDQLVLVEQYTSAKPQDASSTHEIVATLDFGALSYS